MEFAEKLRFEHQDKSSPRSFRQPEAMRELALMQLFPRRTFGVSCVPASALNTRNNAKEIRLLGLEPRKQK